MERFTLYADSEDNGTRLDVFITKALNEYASENRIEREFSRSYVKNLFESGSIIANDGNSAKPSSKVLPGAFFDVLVEDSEEPSVEPENIPLDVVYEDGDIIIINKPRGMVVHPAPGNYSGTLVNALLYYCSDLSSINGVKRPGIVHRIDKDTTGLLAVAKNDRAHRSLAEQLQTHTMRRAYYALVEGIVRDDSGVINAPIGRHPVDRKKMCVNEKNGREAVTHYETLERYDYRQNGRTSLVRCVLETGRTHQIRVHMAHIGHPVCGDPVYGIKNMRGMTGQALHAGELRLIHPSTHEQMTFEAPLPDDFIKLRNSLSNRAGE